MGAGTFYGFPVLPASFKPVLLMVFAPGAFLTLGFMLVGMNRISKALQGGK